MFAAAARAAVLLPLQVSLDSRSIVVAVHAVVAALTTAKPKLAVAVVTTYRKTIEMNDLAMVIALS